MSGSFAVTGLAAAHAGAAVWLLVGSDTAIRRLARLRGLRRPSARSRADAGAGALVSIKRALRFRHPATERRRRSAVPQLCFALAAELRAGRTPAEALERAVASMPAELADELTGVVTESRTGGDVARALRAVATRTDEEGLGRLAACWQVGAGSGAGFAAAVERLGGALRAEEHHRQEVTARLAGPRSTARLLAALPVLGVLMSAGMGMAPFDFLLGSAYGLVCLVAGLGLEIAGAFWTGRLARHAEERT